ncbi:hypothetical protein [Helcococcus ovis]|uniref:hypothetical protein n=1 Tax=Helcococcus ovis TaxID=72026 RepID=UPI00106FFB8A|nr:hypothetical protein [Helcococcus ovis]TFF68615.1 hypothetical protein EQF93_01830 [Helcococcus ovis]WNZ01343.1 hypothetical protein EQF90_000390 [Helcococcus ovis]
MELVLPQNYVEIEQEEMMYLDGGLSVPTWSVTGTITAAVYAFLAASGGAVASGGLKVVLGSMGMRNALAAGIVKALGVVGIKIGNSLAATWLKTIVSGGVSGLASNIATELDKRDGKHDGWVKVF